MIVSKGQEPGAFVVTSKADGKKYVMSDATLHKLIEMAGEVLIDAHFTIEWVVLNEEECKLAEEIRRKYFT